MTEVRATHVLVLLLCRGVTGFLLDSPEFFAVGWCLLSVQTIDELDWSVSVVLIPAAVWLVCSPGVL